MARPSSPVLSLNSLRALHYLTRVHYHGRFVKMQSYKFGRLQANFTTGSTLVLSNASSTAQFYGKGKLLNLADLGLRYTYQMPSSQGLQCFVANAHA